MLENSELLKEASVYVKMDSLNWYSKTEQRYVNHALHNVEHALKVQLNVLLAIVQSTESKVMIV